MTKSPPSLASTSSHVRINWRVMARLAADKLAALKKAFTEDAMTPGDAEREL